MKLKLFVLLFLISSKSVAQKVATSFGVTLSDLDWRLQDDFPTNPNNVYGQKKLYSYYASISLEYFEHKFWSITSSAGTYKKGARDEMKLSENEITYFNWDLSYLIAFCANSNFLGQI